MKDFRFTIEIEDKEPWHVEAQHFTLVGFKLGEDEEDRRLGVEVIASHQDPLLWAQSISGILARMEMNEDPRVKALSKALEVALNTGMQSLFGMKSEVHKG
jgi:hypothetical protein